MNADGTACSGGQSGGKDGSGIGQRIDQAGQAGLDDAEDEMAVAAGNSEHGGAGF